MKRVYVNKDLCIGCGICQVYCAALHSEYPDSVIKAYKLLKYRPVSRLFIERIEAASLSLQCRHCDDPICVSACITGAMYKDPNSGLVLVNEDKCVACYTCIVACPYGAIKENNPTDKYVVKCDMCLGLSKVPVCIENCPNEALVYGKEAIK